MKHNQFYREARLTCPLYRSTEDINIGIYVFKRVFNVWHMLKNSVSMQQHFEQFVRKQRRVELKSVGNNVAKTVLVESANKFSLEELCRTQYILKYFSKPYRPSDPLEKTKIIVMVTNKESRVAVIHDIPLAGLEGVLHEKIGGCFSGSPVITLITCIIIRVTYCQANTLPFSCLRPHSPGKADIWYISNVCSL